MVEEKKKTKPSDSEIVSLSLSGRGNKGLSKERAKALVLFVGFVIVLAFFVFPYLIGLGTSFFASSPSGIVTFVGIIMAFSIIYIGGFQ